MPGSDGHVADATYIRTGFMKAAEQHGHVWAQAGSAHFSGSSSRFRISSLVTACSEPSIGALMA